ncbi:hypothetical protein D3C80_1750360 [compost metagenome]
MHDLLPDVFAYFAGFIAVCGVYDGYGFLSCQHLVGVFSYVFFSRVCVSVVWILN